MFTPDGLLGKSAGSCFWNIIRINFHVKYVFSQIPFDLLQCLDTMWRGLCTCTVSSLKYQFEWLWGCSPMVDAAAVCVIIGILGLNIPGGIKCLSDKYELHFLSHFLWIYLNVWRIHLLPWMWGQRQPVHPPATFPCNRRCLNPKASESTQFALVLQKGPSEGS